MLDASLILWIETYSVTAVYKSGTGTRGRGHRDACVGTWGRETRDLRTSSMGRGDVKYREVGDAGCE